MHTGNICTVKFHSAPPIQTVYNFIVPLGGFQLIERFKSTVWLVTSIAHMGFEVKLTQITGNDGWFALIVQLLVRIGSWFFGMSVSGYEKSEKLICKRNEKWDKDKHHRLPSIKLHNW